MRGQEIREVNKRRASFFLNPVVRRDPTTFDPDVCARASRGPRLPDLLECSTLSRHDDGKVSFTMRYLCKCHWLE